MNDVSQKVKNFFSQYPQLNTKQHDLLYRPEQPLTNVHYIVRGNVRMYAVSTVGQEASLHVFTPGSFIPLMIALSEKTNPYFFETLDECVLAKAPLDDVLAFLKENPDVSIDLNKRFSNAILGMLTRIENLLFDKATENIASLLLYLAKRFGEQTQIGTCIRLSLNHEDIAQWIGVRRETVTRELEYFQKNNIVIIKNKQICIISLDRLQQLVGVVN